MGKSVTVNAFYRAGSKVVKIDTILGAILFGLIAIAYGTKGKSS
ncbi:hypothetical protein [Arenibacter troitsensis]|nr:hypothetical protein [Arenibacter troitsensis]